ncbi:hypothetical protein PVK06_008144 [Gossypium arboreum]|uniref:DUF4283 domain-containing protein n=1 Tax=Gossypium arboreum TaxID=29729 RepID=A0ABR0QJ89_GOSAR|nr:hypothetical protein PVK06_008144 [Gossypium arboreum]
MSVSCDGGDEPRSSEDRITKKVRFKEENEFVLLEGDMVKSIVNRSLTINFSYHIKKILFKEMEKTVVLKLLGRSISYVAFHNRISSLWRPSKPFSLMDIENVYFLAKFQITIDYDIVLSQGPWIIYGQYLTVQTWTKDFSPMQPYPLVVMAWIRLSGLPGYMYKRAILEAAGGMINKVAKLDFQTDKKVKERFVRMAIYINLERPLVSRVLVKGEIQKVEFESLPTIFFSCSKNGHIKEMCPSVVVNLNRGKEDEQTATVSSNTRLGSRFAALNWEEDIEETEAGSVENFQGKGLASGLENKIGPVTKVGVSTGMETGLGCSQGGPSSKVIGKRPMQEFGPDHGGSTHKSVTFKENFDPNKDDVSIATIKAYSGSGKVGPKNKIIKDG